MEATSFLAASLKKRPKAKVLIKMFVKN